MSENYPELQEDLDEAMSELARAHYEKRERSYVSIACMVAAGLALLCSSFMVYYGNQIAWLVVLGSVVAAVLAVGAMMMQPSSMKTADLLLFELGRRLTGTEALLIDPAQREALHKHLYEAAPEVVVAAMKLLAVVGNQESLWYAEGLAGTAPHAHLFTAVIDMDVRHAAVECAEALRERLAVARQSGTLLRAAEAQHDQLLRPHAGAQETDAGSLLRTVAVSEDGKDADDSEDDDER